jgi:hypothetical protein
MKKRPDAISIAVSNDFLTGIILVVAVGGVDLWESGLRFFLCSVKGWMVVRCACEKMRFSVENFLSGKSTGFQGVCLWKKGTTSCVAARSSVHISVKKQFSLSACQHFSKQIKAMNCGLRAMFFLCFSSTSLILTVFSFGSRKRADRPGASSSIADNLK